MLRLMMRSNRYEYLVLRKATEYLNSAIERYKQHRLTMSIIFWFFAPFTLVAFLAYQDHYPIDLGELIWTGSPLRKILIVSIPFFIFSTLLNMLAAWAITHDISHKLVACEVYKINLRTSARAGIMEELVFRYMLLALFIPLVDVINFLAGGFSNSQGALSWFYTTILGPFADSYTFGILTTELVESPWTLGYAIIFANLLFARAHIYQGWLGMMHSWYLGFGFFYLTFNHGLLVAMIVHAAHNSVIHTIKYFDTHWDTRHIKKWKH